MNDVAQIRVIGSMSERASLSETASGKPTARFWLQVTDRRRGKHGQPCDRVSFVECRAVAYAASSVAKYGAKGVEVIVIGRLEVNAYEATDGEQGSDFAVKVEQIGYVSPCEVHAKTGHRW